VRSDQGACAYGVVCSCDCTTIVQSRVQSPSSRPCLFVVRVCASVAAYFFAKKNLFEKMSLLDRSILSLSEETLNTVGWTQEEDCKIVLFTSIVNPTHYSPDTDSIALGICLEGDSYCRYLYMQKLSPGEDPCEESADCWDDQSEVFYALEGSKLLPVGTPFTVSYDDSTTCEIILGISIDSNDSSALVVGLAAISTGLTSDEVLLDCMMSKKEEAGNSGGLKRKRVTLGKVQYGSRDLKSREANRAALLWMDKYAKDIVKIDRVKGRDDQTQQRRYEVLVGSKWKKVRTLSECVSHVMEQCGRDFWEDMHTLPGCIDLAGSSK